VGTKRFVEEAVRPDMWGHDTRCVQTGGVMTRGVRGGLRHKNKAFLVSLLFVRTKNVFGVQVVVPKIFDLQDVVSNCNPSVRCGTKSVITSSKMRMQYTPCGRVN
jgi:hypothetical protein